MSNIIDTIIGNWALILSVVALLGVIVLFIGKIVVFFKLPFTSQKAKIKECLLTWVLDAESALGGQTGKAKLSLVYTYFVSSFPFLKNFISLETFGRWVDEALDEAKELLSENENLAKIVLGDPEESKESK